MLIAQIIGGLGNQMFQYAAARALADSIRLNLALDVSEFDGYALHQGFELFTVFEGPSKKSRIAAPSDVQTVLGWAALKPVRRMLTRPHLAWLRPSSLVIEPHFEYWPGIDALAASRRKDRKQIYMSGYWQSEKYFCDIESDLRQEFRFKPDLVPGNLKIVEKIGTVNAISLHVRRGDYVRNPATLSLHGVCTLEYYQTAIQYLRERVENVFFLVFSDDIGWARENLHLLEPHEYVTHNIGAESFNDMRLMSLCRHHIVANSSFSWWGAWLNPRRDKIVIAPKNWFAQPKNTNDLIPADWVRL